MRYACIHSSIGRARLICLYSALLHSVLLGEAAYLTLSELNDVTACDIYLYLIYNM